VDSESILIVDDDRDIAATVRDYLTREGYAVATAETGAQGLERLRRGGVALLLVDLHLPDMDGALVMRAAQQRTASPEVVVITGYATVDSAVQAVGSFVTDDELKTLLVDQMELIDAAEFGKAQQLISESRIAAQLGGQGRSLAVGGEVQQPGTHELHLGGGGAGPRALDRLLGGQDGEDGKDADQGQHGGHLDEGESGRPRATPASVNHAPRSLAQVRVPPEVLRPGRAGLPRRRRLAG
jgi:CheY-like chemotaxis protein